MCVMCCVSGAQVHLLNRILLPCILRYTVRNAMGVLMKVCILIYEYNENPK